MGRRDRSAGWQRFFEIISKVAVKTTCDVAAYLACAQIRWCAFRIRGPPAPFRLDTSRRKGERQ